LNLCPMLKRSLPLLLLAASLFSQDYLWPIRASQSLSATFAEYRSGHLHAGIDIKTWGEMEVPCIAIADGYIERISVGYNGYGRGLWLRLMDGNVAVYGHLEQFTPSMEALVSDLQLESDSYFIRKRFSPQQFPVRAGAVIGYSGTSGTEHPHLHFEIRDSLREVINPQFFYPGVKDQRPPILDEIMLLPAEKGSRINGSAFPVVFDTSDDLERIAVTGPFWVAVNTHDRANGTYNKYNVYQLELLLNDSLRFLREFHRVPLRLTDDVDKVYPGMRGKRKWRFTSLYDPEPHEPAPFVAHNLSGRMEVEGLSTLLVRIADIKGNQVSQEVLLQETVPAQWSVQGNDSTLVIKRSFPADGYENYQFYTGSNRFIPIKETLYSSTSTTWVMEDPKHGSGVRALGAAAGGIRWVIPPSEQDPVAFTTSWATVHGEMVLRIESDGPWVFPIAFRLHSGQDRIEGELIQTGPQQAETTFIPQMNAALADSVTLNLADRVVTVLPLSPMTRIGGQTGKTFTLGAGQASLEAWNHGSADLFVRLDTASASFDDTPVQGVSIQIIQQGPEDFSGNLIFTSPDFASSPAIFAPGKRNSWKRLTGPDSSGMIQMEILSGGRFFLLDDVTPPQIRPRAAYDTVDRDQRLVFHVEEATGSIKIPKSGLRATLDGQAFFPDYNPLRDELSFHIPQRLGAGQHVLEFVISDASGNKNHYRHGFKLNP